MPRDRTALAQAEQLRRYLLSLCAQCTVLAHQPNGNARDSWLRVAWLAADTEDRLGRRATEADLAPLLSRMAEVGAVLPGMLLSAAQARPADGHADRPSGELESGLHRLVALRDVLEHRAGR